MEIAKALQLNYAFFCEFEELESPKRSLETQASRVMATTVSTAISIINLSFSIDLQLSGPPAKSPQTTAAARLTRLPCVQGGGVHGNAILSRFDMQDVRLVRHK